MKFFLSIASIAVYATVFLSLVACSNDKSVAGIEIGNPSLADADTTVKDTSAKDTSIIDTTTKDTSDIDTTVKDTSTKDTSVKKQPALPLTAEFSVDYSDVARKALFKETEKDEPILLDSFSLVLTQVRSFSSYYYTSLVVDPILGLQLWPYEDNPDETLEISFTQGTSDKDHFKDIDLQEEGYLKEMGVSFRPDESAAIFGRVKIDDKYVPFEYSLTNFQSFMLRYHYSQIDTAGGKGNLSVVFRVKSFVQDIDFSDAKIGSDRVIHIDSENNSDLWEKLNKQFIPSFKSLRYDYKTADEDSTFDYVVDIWHDIAAKKGENTIINGNFASPFTTDWILMNQFGGRADTTVLIEKGSKERIMQVDVINGGSRSYSVQLIQENVALIAGVQYQCVFTIWSDVEGQITARIGSYNTYETIGFQEHVQVQTTGHSVGITFTPEVSDPFARFELNLGGEERTFWIKEVQVLRIN